MGLTINNTLYHQLLCERPPHKIESADEYDDWAQWIESVDFAPEATPEQKALSELMTLALEEYDRRQHPELSAVDPLGSLRFLMESNGMTQADLSRLLGISRTTASQIYNGQRGISKASALKLAERFALPVSIFLS